MLYTPVVESYFTLPKGTASRTHVSIRCQFKLDGISQQGVPFGGFGFGQPVAAGGQIVKGKQTCTFCGQTHRNTIFTKLGIQAALYPTASPA